MPADARCVLRAMACSETRIAPRFSCAIHASSWPISAAVTPSFHPTRTSERVRSARSAQGPCLPTRKILGSCSNAHPVASDGCWRSSGTTMSKLRPPAAPKREASTPAVRAELDSSPAVVITGAVGVAVGGPDGPGVLTWWFEETRGPAREHRACLVPLGLSKDAKRNAQAPRAREGRGGARA